VPRGEGHLVVRSIRAGLAHAGVRQPGLRVQCRNVIPHGRGLGSSAAAVVAGLVAARGCLADPARLGDGAVLALATDAEGHPDNASASLFGGFVVSWTEPTPDGREVGRSVGVPVHPDVMALLCIPEGELSTEKARAMLPRSVPHGDAAYNAARSALLVEAMSRRPDLLLPATEDRLHQDQRGPAMPQTAALIAQARARGIAAVVSGAGPSVLSLGVGDTPARVMRELTAGTTWRILQPAIDTRGAHVVPDGDAGTGVA
jgi:homoserine kinase